jgi:hypothetical protein
MRSKLSITVVGLSVSAVLAATYALMFVACAIAALLFPGWGMMTEADMMAGAMQAMPGFGWSIVGFVIGLAWAVIGGFYVAAIYVPVYNYLQSRAERREAEVPVPPAFGRR